MSAQEIKDKAAKQDAANANSVTTTDGKTKKAPKLSYKKMRETFDSLIASGVMSAEQAEKQLAAAVKAGKVSDPNSVGIGAKDKSAEAIEIREAFAELLKTHKQAVDVLKARKVVPQLYMKGASKTAENTETK